MEEKLKELVKNNWEFSLSYQDGSFLMVLCKPEWITNNLAQSRSLPMFTSYNSIEDVINKAYKYALKN